MNTKILLATIAAVGLTLPLLPALAVTNPDTDCSQFGVNYVAGVGAPAVGTSPGSWANPPHAYVGLVAGTTVSSTDTCTNYAGLGDPTLFSGEFGFGIGGGHLFARAGADGSGNGEGTVGCF